MPEPKHSPGPWRYEEGAFYKEKGDIGPYFYIFDSNSKCLADIENDDEKIARVMAASGDLLEVCEDILEWAEDLPQDILRKLKAAVAKAKGEEIG